MDNERKPRNWIFHICKLVNCKWQLIKWKSSPIWYLWKHVTCYQSWSRTIHFWRDKKKSCWSFWMLKYCDDPMHITSKWMVDFVNWVNWICSHQKPITKYQIERLWLKKNYFENIKSTNRSSYQLVHNVNSRIALCNRCCCFVLRCVFFCVCIPLIHLYDYALTIVIFMFIFFFYLLIGKPLKSHLP